MIYIKEITFQITKKITEFAFAHITFFVAQIDFYCYGYSSIPYNLFHIIYFLI